MYIDVAKHIGELLYTNNRVIIPELGAIVATYQSASIDHVQGLISPPSKKLSFNENLLMNDGLLVDYVKRKNKISLKEAVNVVSQFVLDTKKKLNNKEIVILPKIGRLYKDYENSLRFLQDATNFNPKVYGLPTLNFYPILRSQDAPNPKREKPVRLVAKKNNGIRRSLSKKIASVFIPVFVGIVAVVFTIGLFNKQKQTVENSLAIQKIPINENRLNKKPSLDNLSFFDGISIDGQENISKNKTKPTPQIPVFSDQINEAVIIVGVFSKKSGVQKKVKEIYDFGYDAFQDKKGKLTRVGVRFEYEKKSEIKEMLSVVRRNFDSRAWILEE